MVTDRIQLSFKNYFSVWCVIQNDSSNHCSMLGLKGKLVKGAALFIEQRHFCAETTLQIKRTLEGLNNGNCLHPVLSLKFPTLLVVALERQMEMAWSSALIAQWASPSWRVRLSSQTFPVTWVIKCGATHTQMRLVSRLAQKVAFVEWIHELRNAWGYQRGNEEAEQAEIFKETYQAGRPGLFGNCLLSHRI